MCGPAQSSKIRLGNDQPMQSTLPGDEPDLETGESDVAPNPLLSANTQDLLVEWERRTRLNLKSHNLAERHFDRLNATCSVISIATLVALGTSATSFDLTEGWGRVIAITLSVVAALAATLQAVRGYAGLAESHRVAARRHAALSREIERIALRAASGGGESDLDALQHRWDQISEGAPNVPPWLRRKAKKSGFPHHFIRPSKHL